MNFKRITQFLATCRDLSISDASKSLGISQPALSKSMHRLEDELGITLFKREHKHLSLTPEGERIRQKYSDLDHQVRKVEKDLRTLAISTAQTLSIAVAQSIRFTPLARFLSAFLHRYPELQVEIIDCEHAESASLLNCGQVDCIFTIHSVDIENSFNCLPLYHEPVSMCQIGENSPLSQSPFSPVVCRQHLWNEDLQNVGLLTPQASPRTAIEPEINNTKMFSDSGKLVIVALPMARYDQIALVNLRASVLEYNWISETATCE